LINTWSKQDKVNFFNKRSVLLDIEKANQYIVAVIGAGPAGLFAARQLAKAGSRVVLFNRDIKPGGLAEYGIYFTKHKMKAGLRKQFHQILDLPELDYYGNISIGQNGDLSLTDLQDLGFQAILVTVGAQGTKWLGLPGEELPRGVYHAKDLVYHYNKLPPFSQKDFAIGRRAAIIGVGNVMLDIARWLIREKKVDEVVAVARRGPAEVKFDKKEMQSVIANLDQVALDEEIKAVTPKMEAVGQDPEAAKDFILSALPKSSEAVSDTRFYFDFMASPKRILGDESGQVCGLEVEETKLIPYNGDTKARGTGVTRILDVDTVIYCIGDKVDDTFGLPVQWNEFVKNPSPQYPVEELSYEVIDPDSEKPIDGIFVAGWSREASSGLVGVARKDGERGAKALLQYVETLSPPENIDEILEGVQERIRKLDVPVVTKQDIKRLEAAEADEAKRLSLEEFKFSSNEQMLAAMGLARDPV
jgi:ferredoxin--NADP+ reductase